VIAVVNDSHSGQTENVSTIYIISLSSIDKAYLPRALRAHDLEEIRLEFSRCGYYRVDPTLCTPDFAIVSIPTSSRFSIMSKRADYDAMKNLLQLPPGAKLHLKVQARQWVSNGQNWSTGRCKIK
jgi:hypothetical protein